MLDLVSLMLAASAALTTPALEPAEKNPPTTVSVEKPEQAPAKLPTEAFARLPFIELAEISPDGTHIAGLFAIGGVQQ
ncbi:MAG: S9 family peptidase, partial [Allopontixanthobacter sediminis]